LYGDHIGSADIAVGCACLWLDFRMPQLDWRIGHPALRALIERLAVRPSFQQTVPIE
jgi:glutathione S-transferase